MFLSIIIPAHNEEHRLPPTLKTVDAFLERQPYASEIIVVENGSQDLTAVFSELVKRLALPGFEDTQCGFKCFRGEVAADLFGVQVFDGMSFDVEVLYVAVKRGYRVLEVPIDWYYRSESRVQPLADPLRML